MKGRIVGGAAALLALTSYGDAAAPGDLGAATMAAAINADGVLARSAGAVSASRFGRGIYDVRFGRDISRCFYSANPAAYGAYFAVAYPNSLDNTALQVFVFAFVGGSSVDLNVHVIVYCSS